jgi:hypothetical protein
VKPPRSSNHGFRSEYTGTENRAFLNVTGIFDGSRWFQQTPRFEPLSARTRSNSFVARLSHGKSRFSSNYMFGVHRYKALAIVPKQSSRDTPTDLFRATSFPSRARIPLNVVSTRATNRLVHTAVFDPCRRAYGSITYHITPVITYCVVLITSLTTVTREDRTCSARFKIEMFKIV